MGKRAPLSVRQASRPNLADAPVHTAQMTAHAAAAGNDPAMATWNPYPGSADADILPDLSTLVPRSRDLARNNGLMAGVSQTYKDNIVGAILRLSAKPNGRLLGWDDAKCRDWSAKVEAEFQTWADTTECDAANELSLLGLTLQALSGSVGNGDALALPIWLERPGQRWHTKLMMVETDRLSTPPERLSDPTIRGGRKFDSWGACQGYYIRRHHPGDRYGYGEMGGFTGLAWPDMDVWDYVPATTEWGRRRVLYLYDKDREGQSRGKPLVSAVMKEFHMAGKYCSTELQASVANSMIAAFLESNLDADSSAALFGEKPRDNWKDSVREARRLRIAGGPAVLPLPVGAKVTSFTPNRPNAAFEAFMHAVLRQIAAGLNLPYELLLKDFSQTNYSSARAALLEAWRYFHGRRRWLTDYWLRPNYELWLEEAVNAGRIEAPNFYEMRHAYTRCRFIFAGRGWVDPTREAQAAQLRMQIGVSTLESECAEQGQDWEEVLTQRAYEQARMRELGLPDANPAVQPNTNQEASQDQPQDSTEEKTDQ